MPGSPATPALERLDDDRVAHASHVGGFTRDAKAFADLIEEAVQATTG